MRVLFITGRKMTSVENECAKMMDVFRGAGHDVECVQYDRPRLDYKYVDLAIWWTPLLALYVRYLGTWCDFVRLKKLVFYTVIEGIHNRLFAYRRILDRQFIVTPSLFSKRCIEEMGFRVGEVIPHQLDVPLNVDFDFGRRWRSRFPSDKRVLLYNGSNINRKGLSRLREAIDVLSRRRGDFVFVLHTDDFRYAFHTDVNSLRGVNTVVEVDFSKLSLSQVYGKMWACDVFVFPSMCEGFGLPVAEAFALGKPVVCVDAPGVNEIANPGNSWMVTRVVPRDLVWFDWMVYRAVDYDAVDLADMIELCLDASNDEVGDKRARGFDAIKRLRGSYKEFLKFLGGV